VLIGKETGTPHAATLEDKMFFVIGIAATVCCYIYTTLCIMRANQGNVQCDTL